VPNNVNLQSELLCVRESLVVMTNNVNTLLIIAVLLNNANTFIDISLVTKLVYLVNYLRRLEKYVLERTTVRHVDL
jgi:hypothetical protein